MLLLAASWHVASQGAPALEKKCCVEHAVAVFCGRVYGPDPNPPAGIYEEAKESLPQG